MTLCSSDARNGDHTSHLTGLDLSQMIWIVHVEGQLSGDQGTLLVVEAPRLFVTSPAGGKLRKVPHAGPIYCAGSLLDSSTFLVETRDEEGKLVFEKISQAGQVLFRYPAPVGAFASAFSPDGKQYLYADVHWNLVLQEIEGNTGRKLFEPTRGEQVLHPAMSPERAMVVFSLFINDPTRVMSRLCLLQVNQQFHRDRCVGERVSFPVFSSDGTKLAYWVLTKQPPDPTWSIVVQEISATGELGATTIVASRDFRGMYEDRRIEPISWSPDSEWLMWAVQGEQSSPFYDLFRIRVGMKDIQEVPLQRSWWTTFWREYLLPADKNRFAFNFQWVPYSVNE